MTTQHVAGLRVRCAGCRRAIPVEQAFAHWSPAARRCAPRVVSWGYRNASPAAPATPHPPQEVLS